MKRTLKITRGSAEYCGIFEQNITKRFDTKVFMGIPAEVNHSNIRTHNAIMVAQYQLQCQILNDSYIFDRCCLNKRGWKYERKTKAAAS